MTERTLLPIPGQHKAEEGVTLVTRCFGVANIPWWEGRAPPPQVGAANVQHWAGADVCHPCTVKLRINVQRNQEAPQLSQIRILAAVDGIDVVTCPSQPLSGYCSHATCVTASVELAATSTRHVYILHKCTTTAEYGRLRRVFLQLGSGLESSNLRDARLELPQKIPEQFLSNPT